MDIGKKIGFTEDVQALVKKSVDLTTTQIRNNPSISHLLKRIEMNPDSYISSHSLLLAHIACGIARFARLRIEGRYFASSTFRTHQNSHYLFFKQVDYFMFHIIHIVAH